MWGEGACREARSQRAHLYPDLLLHFLPLLQPESLGVKTLIGVYIIMPVLPHI